MKKVVIFLMVFTNFIMAEVLAPVKSIESIIPTVPKIAGLVEPKVVPKIAPVAPVAPKAIKPIVPVPAAPTPVVPTPVVPKAVVPVAPAPVMPTPVVPTAVVPKMVTSAQPGATKFESKAPTASQEVGIITVKNMSKYTLPWTGWKTKYKTQDGKVHYKLHQLKTPHQLPHMLNNKASKTWHGYTVHNLPAHSFVEGVSHLMINDQPVLVEYQGSAWMPGTTDAIYVSSVNGTTVTLDKKAMDKSYKEINLGITKSKKTKKIDDDSISKVTDVTKAASVPVVLTDKKNKKKFSNIKSSAKISKSSQVFDSAVAVKAG